MLTETKSKSNGLDTESPLATVLRLGGYNEETAYAKNATIFNAGDSADYLYYVTSGLIKLQRTDDRKGVKLTTTLVGPGNLMDYETFGLPDIPHSSTAIAQRASKVIPFPSTILPSLLQDPEIFPFLLENISRQLEDAHDKNIIFETYGNGRRRVALALHAYNPFANEDGILTDIFHEDLADYAGVTEKTVTRTLDFAQRRGAIKRPKKETSNGKQIEIVNSNTLKSIALS